MMVNKRQVNFEVLRVVAMLCVVLCHVLGHGMMRNKVTFSDGFFLNSISYPILWSFASMGVICFVMISGYFLCDNTTLKLHSIFKIWSVTLFYSVGTTVAALFLDHRPITEGWQSLFPLWSDQYWFVTKYIALLILSPFLAFYVKSISRRGLLYTIGATALLTMTITCGIPFGNKFFQDNPFSVAVFVLYFFIAAYIRLYDIPNILSRHCGKIFVGLILFQGGVGVVQNIFLYYNQPIVGGFSVGYNCLSILPATALFVWFKNHQFNGGLMIRLLSWSAKYAFAVYLIHDNLLVRHKLWYEWLDCSVMWHSPLWLLNISSIIVSIYIMGVAVDILRDRLFKIIGIIKVQNLLNQYRITIK